MYKMMIHDGYDWTTLAEFDPAIFDIMVQSGRSVAVNPTMSPETVVIMDCETGEILWDIDEEDEPDYEPADIDDDCGFDPYMGCFTDDC